jgi:predicted nucleotidyltransferase
VEELKEFKEEFNPSSWSFSINEKDIPFDQITARIYELNKTLELLLKHREMLLDVVSATEAVIANQAINTVERCIAHIEKQIVILSDKIE